MTPGNCAADGCQTHADHESIEESKKDALGDEKVLYRLSVVDVCLISAQLTLCRVAENTRDDYAGYVGTTA